MLALLQGNFHTLTNLAFLVAVLVFQDTAQQRNNECLKA